MKTKTTLSAAGIFLATWLNCFGQPVITTDPQSRTNVVGSTLTLSVEAAGVSPLSYQWKKASLTVAGATNTALVFTNFQSSQAGNYTVVITNMEGAVTSAVAFVRVLVPPAITTQPTSFPTLSLGVSVSNRVAASGTTPLYYQWRLNGTSLPGETNTLLVITNLRVSNAGAYTAVVTNSAASVTSVVVTLSVDPTFTKITTGNIATDGSASTACAWGDYDNDGWPDLFVNNRDARNFLYRNKRDGTFEKITTGHLVTNTVTHLAGVWGDYDNDGYLDMLVVNGGCCAGNQRNFLYHNNGDGTFSQPSAATAGSLVSDAGGFHGAAWGDYDGDGFLDVVVANYTGSNYLYRSVGGTNFGRIATLGSNGAEAAWADYDNDGDVDLFTVHHNGNKNFLYRNDGNGVLNRVTTGPFSLEVGASAGASWGDFDNDGFFDLFVSNFSGGRDLFYHNRGDGTFEKIIQSPLVNESADTYGPAWGDYDNDGFLDMFVANGFYGNGGLDNYLFHNNGDGTFEKILSGSLVNDQGHSIGCAWADYDKDGFLDLFVANDPNFDGGAPEINFLYRNNGNSNGWLKVRLVGTVSNRSGIGAKVRVKAHYAGQDRWQLRQIASSDGRVGGSLEAHFGLGDATIIDTLRIEWPSGIVQEFHGVSVKQHLTVTEPARLQVLGAGVLRIQSWKGMAFELQASTDLVNWLPTSTVTNLAGTLEFKDVATEMQMGRFYRTLLR